MILIKEADIYAPEHLGIRDVLICGERVEAVGENLPALCNCRIIEARGKRLTPGPDRPARTPGRGRRGGELPYPDAGNLPFGPDPVGNHHGAGSVGH